MPCLTLWKFRLCFERHYCMVEYVKNINVRYISDDISAPFSVFPRKTCLFYRPEKGHW